jgi:hypothetical protein
MTKRDLTYQIQAAIAEAISHGATRAQVEELAYRMRQAAAKEEASSESLPVPDDDPPPPKAA